MSGIAIMMMVLFMVVIWGGLLASILALKANPDEKAGVLGESRYATDDVLIRQEDEHTEVPAAATTATEKPQQVAKVHRTSTPLDPADGSTPAR